MRTYIGIGFRANAFSSTDEADHRGKSGRCSDMAFNTPKILVVDQAGGFLAGCEWAGRCDLDVIADAEVI